MGTSAKRLLSPLTLLALLLMCSGAQAKSSKGSTRCSSPIRSGSLESGLEEPIPTELLSTLEAPVLSSFAVFRRAAQASDQIPALSPVGGNLDSQIASYYPAYVREVRALPRGERFYVVPGFRRVVNSRPKPGPTLELAPDDVVAVRITYDSAAPVAVQVSENAYTYQPPRSVVRRAEEIFKRFPKEALAKKHLTKAQQDKILNRLIRLLDRVASVASPVKVEWLDASGAVIRTIPRPKGAGPALNRLTLLGAG